MSSGYLHHMPGGRWIIGFRIGERHVTLAADSYLDEESDLQLIFDALGITPTADHVDKYFPITRHGRSPTLELLELCAIKLDPTNPLRKEERVAVASV